MNRHPKDAPRRPGRSKRICDLVISITALLVLLPLLAVIALAVKLSSRGPALYAGIRGGLDGVPFRILKFRSMVDGAESIGGSATAENDPRITPVGHWIRRTKVDELPQLINVIKGEMSLVGPRPEVYRYVARYSAQDSIVLSVLPGLTDWASLWDIGEGSTLRRYEDSEAAYAKIILPEKLKLQRYYVEHWSLLDDFRIMFNTAAKLFHRSWIPRRLRQIMHAKNVPIIPGQAPGRGVLDAAPHNPKR